LNSSISTIIALAIIIIVSDYYFKIQRAKNKVKEEDYKKTLKYNYKRKQFYMTKSENDFYQRLVRIFGDKYFIFPQVCLATILDEKVNDHKDHWAARNVINRKSVDYLICDKTYINPLVAIELDDWSHDRDNRKERDSLVEKIFIKANMPLVRYRDVRQMQDNEIVQKIEQYINT